MTDDRHVQKSHRHSSRSKPRPGHGIRRGDTITGPDGRSQHLVLDTRRTALLLRDTVGGPFVLSVRRVDGKLWKSRTGGSFVA